MLSCPLTNNAGFNITINGTSPTPNKVSARINTMQDVHIVTIPFSMTEELFSDRIVPNAINIEMLACRRYDRRLILLLI